MWEGEKGGKSEGRGGRGVCGREREVVHVSGEGGRGGKWEGREVVVVVLVWEEEDEST